MVVVEGCVEVRHGLLEDFVLAAEFLVLAIEERVAAEVVECAMFGGGHQPGAGVVRDA